MRPLQMLPRTMWSLGICLILLLPYGAGSQVRTVPSTVTVQKGEGRSSPGDAQLRPPASQHPTVANHPLPPPEAPISQAHETDFRIAGRFSVVNTDTGGSGSLKQAILDANGNPGTDSITFNIPGAGVHTIDLKLPLPFLTGPVHIDGTTEDGYTGTPLIEISGTNAPAGSSGLVIRGGSSSVRGLTVNGFKNNGIYGGHGIVLENLGGNTIEGNYVGTDPLGLSARPNGGSGIVIAGPSSRNRIGAPSAAGRNILSGNGGTGIQISTGSGGRNLIRGNIIGADASGMSALPNQGNGVFVDAQNDTLGGLLAGMGNLISGNALPGLYLGSSARRSVVQGNYIGTTLTGNAALGNASNGIMIDSAAYAEIRNNIVSGNLTTGIYMWGIPATGNTILGNYIGTNLAGTAALANGSNGIVVVHAPMNVIGSPSHSNLISGNTGVGVWISGGNATGTIIESNSIGTNLAGTDSIPNGAFGIYVQNSPLTAIGGSSASSGNIVSGNRLGGVWFWGYSAQGSTVTRSFIGTDGSGRWPLPNKGSGILIDEAPDITIGGVGTGANVISGNTQAGISIVHRNALGNRIIGNLIGTDAGGTAALPNGAGIVINDAPLNTIGGSLPGEGNTISGNTFYGIGIRNASATGNSVVGNYIGTGYGGTRALGNGTHGVLLIAPANTIGGTDPSQGNKIAHNGGAGVFDSLAGGNLIRMNSIFDNQELGIDLAPRGFTKNDPLDVDSRLNFPIIDSVNTTLGSTTIRGRFLSYARGTFTLDFYLNSGFDPSHFGEGAFHFGSTTVTTNDTGLAEINLPIPVQAPGNNYITATATHPRGGTSEFSQAYCLSDLDGDGILDSWESQGWGMDVNSDGECDLDLYAMGARPDHKDIFVEVDAMENGDPGGFNKSLGPPATAFDSVKAAFAAVPNALLHNPDGRDGINLSILYEHTLWIPNSKWYDDTWPRFYDTRRVYFGTHAERLSPNRVNILTAKGRVFRYCIFGDDYDAKGHSSGWSNGIISNNFMVTLGAWRDDGSEEQRIGTFMHELGHSLGLRHGGGDDINYKPNYISIMNYTWQNPLESWMPPGAWKLRYSTSALPALNEGNLIEPAGLSPSFGAYPVLPVPFRDGRDSIHWAHLMPGAAVDWDGNGDSTSPSSIGVSADVNYLWKEDWSSPGQELLGFDDWSHLVYNFRNSPTFTTTGAGAGVLAEADMTLDIYQTLQSLPPPKPAGRFVMDGLLDSTAILLGAHGGITLHAAVRGGQLYVATNSAESQAADMVVLVAIPPGTLQQAPLGKSGQIAGWSAMLFNRSSDNSRGWYNGNSASLAAITVDTARTVLEGVIDFYLLMGAAPESVYIAVGKYEPGSSGALLMQVPWGNGDANIDADEFFSLNPAPLGARWRQQGEKIVPHQSGSVQAFVALSSDGNTGLIGGREPGDMIGGAWVYRRSSNQWIKEGTRLIPAGAVGSNVQQQYPALSADGNTAIVGGPWDNGGIGAAWVYVCNNGVWSQQGNKLVGTGAIGNALQGRAVAISADGNTAVVLGMSDNGGTGAAWVFVRQNGSWTQQGSKLTPVGSAGMAGLSSVAISGDGNTVILGGYKDDNERGAAWVYVRNGTLWSLQGTKLVGSGITGDRSWQGVAVALSYDGNTALVGGPADDARQEFGQGVAVGATWVFTRTNGIWTQDGSKLVGLGYLHPAVMQGSAVALSSDGNAALVGGPNDGDGSTYAGAVWVFKRRFGQWVQDGGKLVGRHPVSPMNTSQVGQGSTLALSGDGSTALIGSYEDSLYRGAVWVFVSSDSIPFRITSISGTNLAGGAVQIGWTTFSEMSNCSFIIQRKMDQGTEYGDVPNGAVTGRGAPDVSQSYQFTDSAVAPGSWTYRVKGVDLGGRIVFSDPVLVDVVTGIGESGMPRIFSLSQNYPNPWNPSTTIRFGLPYRTHVSIAVYNVLGQCVARIVDEPLEAGYHSVLFKTSGLASGTYFYRIMAGEFVQTKKMLHLK